MAFELIVLRRAQKEILGAIEWYENRRIGLGEIFFTEVETEFQRILDNPLLFPKSNASTTNFRRAVLKNFPFIIIFSLSRDQVIIHSVFHTHLNPNKKPSV